MARRRETTCRNRIAHADFASTRNASTTFGGIFDVDGKRRALTEREERMSRNGFWDDHERAQVVIQEIKQLKEWVEPSPGSDTLRT